MNRYLTTWIKGILIILIGPGALAQQTDSQVGELMNLSKVINPSVEAQPLNSKVNSPYFEAGPILTKDGSRLYFNRNGHPDNTGGIDDQDIWFSDFDETSQSWMDAVNVGEPLNNLGPNFICGVGWKGDTILLGNVYGKKGKMTSGISISVRTGDLWSFPTPVYVSNDYNLSDRVSYDLSHDRTSLIIAEEKSDSHGKLDLYVAFRDPDGRHTYSGTESINLGPVINSFGNETSPFLAYDGQTLYFSSDGHNGYGGLDIFVSKRLDKTWTNWSKPENLGPGINAPYDDSDFGFTPYNRYAYYSRGITHSNADIYRVDMTHLFKPNRVPLDQLKENDNPMNVGQTTVVNHVFTGDSKEINKSAIADLDYFIKYLQIYKKMIVLIGAHSPRHAARAESLQLSIERANKMLDYLVKSGIDKNRLIARGFGHDLAGNTGSQVSTQASTKESKETKESPNDISSSVEFRYVGVVK